MITIVKIILRVLAITRKIKSFVRRYARLVKYAISNQKAEELRESQSMRVISQAEIFNNTNRAGRRRIQAWQRRNRK